MLLSLTSYAATPTSLTVADNTSTPPYALVADQLDWGNARFEHQYSAPRGTQGARPAAGIPQNRTVSMQLRVYGTSKTNLATNLRNLAMVLDELRRFGGRLTWQSAGQSFRQSLEVMGTDGAQLGAWGNRPENRNIATVDVALSCAPYAKGDPMDVSDPTFAALSSDYTLDSGSIGNLSNAGSKVTASAALTTEYRLVHTSRGYDLGDVETSVQLKVGSTVTGWKGGAIAWRSSANDYIVAYVDDNGTNSRLRIDQVTGGTTTNRATVNLASRVTANQTVYVVLRTEGLTVSAEYWTAAPTPMGTPTLTTSWTATTAATGRSGALFIPQAATAEIDALTVRPYTYSKRALPATWSMFGAIPGDVPATAGVEATTVQALPFALFAWQQTPAASSLSGSPIPRSAFTVFNGNDDVSAARTGWVCVDSTRNVISTTFVSVSASSSGTTATTYTYTTASAHGLTTGQTVTVSGVTPSAYNQGGTVTVTSSTQFTITGKTFSVTSTASGTTYTYTTASAHGLTTGDTVTLTGFGVAAYNATSVTVTVTGATTFTRVGGTSGPAASSGTLVPNPAASSASGTVREILGALSSMTFNAEYPLDPSLLPIDAYADGDRAIEVWALLRTDSSSKLALPTVVASVKAAAGGGVIRYTDEWGSAGRIVPTASSTATNPVLRWTRLGTIHLPTAGSREMRLALAGSVATGSVGGVFGIARVVLLPVRQRAASPTAKANDSTYPAWSLGTTEAVKYVDSDLSTTAYQPSSSLVPLGDRSLGGSPIEIMPGNTSFGVILAANVPDSPTADSTTENLGIATPPTASSQPQATVHVSVTPRFAYLR